MFHPFLSKVACSAFFLLPGMFYGALMSRLPAIKAQLELTDSMIGATLFVFGIFGLTGLVFSNKLITKYSSKSCLKICGVIGLIGLLITGAANSFYWLLVGSAVLGIGVSVLDVAMNTQGVLYEHKAKKPTLNLFHAFYSFGAVLASAVGAFCAAQLIDVEINFIGLSVPLVFFSLLFGRFLLADYEPKTKAEETNKKAPISQAAVPLLVVICGIAASLGYATEGSVGEWGALYLNDEKVRRSHWQPVYMECSLSSPLRPDCLVIGHAKRWVNTI